MNVVACRQALVAGNYDRALLLCKIGISSTKLQTTMLELAWPCPHVFIALLRAWSYDFTHLKTKRLLDFNQRKQHYVLKI